MISSEVTSHRGNYHALCIGLDNYQKQDDLKCAAKDAVDVAEEFKKRGFNIRLHVSVSNDKAMKKLTTEFFAPKRAVQGVQNGDTAIFYFAGHGRVSPDDNEMRLCLFDGDYKLKVIMPAHTGVELALHCIRTDITLLACRTLSIRRGRHCNRASQLASSLIAAETSPAVAVPQRTTL
jgi:hypothetical protein